MSRSHALLLLLLVACERPREVAVRVSIPGVDSLASPVRGLEVLALPYNRDSLLAQLEARAPTRRPDAAPLDSAFADFRRPFAAYTAAAYRAAQLRDSGAAAESLRVAEARRDRARQALDSARVTLVRRTASLRAAVRAWEDSTYRGWDSLVRGLAAARHQAPHADTTDARGWAHLTLPSGRWWIHARSWDANDPNAEWYWNVPVESDTVLLSPETGRHQPRY